MKTKELKQTLIDFYNYSTNHFKSREGKGHSIDQVAEFYIDKLKKIKENDI